MKIFKKFLLLSLLLTSLWQSKVQAQVQLSAENITVSGTDLTFDIYLTNLGAGSFGLFGSDFVLDFDASQFTSPTISQASNPDPTFSFFDNKFCEFTSIDFPGPGPGDPNLLSNVQVPYANGTIPTIIGSQVVINLNNGIITTLAEYNSHVAQIDGTASTHRLGRYILSGYNGADDGALSALSWDMTNTLVFEVLNDDPAFTVQPVTVDPSSFVDLADPCSFSSTAPIYVDIDNTSGTEDGTSWANAYTDLQDAIDAWCNNAQIWVAEGTYLPSVEFDVDYSGGADPREKTFYIDTDGIEIYGGFAGTETSNNPTGGASILSGDLGTLGDNTDNAYHVVYIDGTTTPITNATILQDFTIQDGNANTVSTNSNGGGVYNNGNSGLCSPSFNNCIFTSNNASFGGAIFNEGDFGISSPNLTNCIITSNAVSSRGGAVYNRGFDGISSSIFINCTITSNSAGFRCGGIYNQSSTFYFQGESNPVLVNCILWGNSSPNPEQNLYNENATPNTSHSIIEGSGGSAAWDATNFGTDGGNNLDTDPLFVNAPTDVSLQSCSPAINAGDNAANTTPTDLAGNPRIYNSGVIDMGAYEYQGVFMSCISATATQVQGLSCFADGNGIAQITVTGGTAPFVASGTSYTSNPFMITDLAGGTQTFMITDASGAMTTATVTIDEPELLSCFAFEDIGESCFGESDGGATAFPSGGTPPFTVEWDNGEVGEQAIGLSQGYHEVTVTDANGCTTFCDVTISGPSNDLFCSVSLNSNISCFGASDGSATVTVQGGTPPYTYFWSSAESSATAISLPAGTNYVDIFDANNCFYTCSISISEPSSLSCSASVNNNVSCNGEFDGSATVSAFGGTPPYAYFWSNGTTAATATMLSAGAYTVTVLDANDCQSSCNVTITEPALLTANATVTANATCPADADGSIDLTVSGGTGFYTYMWDNGATVEDLFGLPVGTYTVEVTDANACTASATATVGSSDNTPPTITCPANLTLNCGDDTSPSSTGIATAMDNLSMPANIFISFADATSGTCPSGQTITRTWTATDECGNSATCAQTITVEVPTVDITFQVNTANIPSIDPNGIFIAGGGNFGNPGDNPLTDLGNGFWKITVTRPKGFSSYYTLTNGACPDYSCKENLTGLPCADPANFNDRFLPAVCSDTTLLHCFGACTTDLTCPPPPQDIDITLSVDMSQYMGTFTGVYINGTFNGWCGPCNPMMDMGNGVWEVTITIPENEDIQYKFTVDGWSDQENLTAGESCTTTNGSFINRYFAGATGDTTIPTVCWNSCDSCPTFSAIATVTQNVTCNGGTDGQAEITVTGGTAPYMVSGVSYASNPFTVSGLAAGMQTITITDDNGNGTMTTVNVTITEPALLDGTAVETASVLCNGEANGQATATGSGGTPPYTFQWDNGELTIPAVFLTAGLHTVTITDANDCMVSSDVMITEPSPITMSVQPTNQTACVGDNVSFSAMASGGVGSFTYQWQKVCSGVATNMMGENSTSLTINNVNSADNACQYRVVVTDANACTLASNAASIGMLEVDVTLPDQMDCAGATITFDGTASGGIAPLTYQWTRTCLVSTFSNQTSSNGLADNNVKAVYVDGTTIYAATNGGLSISTNGTTWANRTTTDGLGANSINDVLASGSMVYVATSNGVSISTDGGSTFTNHILGANSPIGEYDTYALGLVGATLYVGTTEGVFYTSNAGTTWANYTTADGLASNYVTAIHTEGSTLYFGTGNGLTVFDGSTWATYDTTNGIANNSINAVASDASNIYVGTGSGLSISNDNGTTWTTYNTVSGLGTNQVNAVYVNNGNIYLGTTGGLTISTDGGTNWVNYTTTEGLGSDNIQDVYIANGMLYAATNNGLSHSAMNLTETIMGANAPMYSFTASVLDNNCTYQVEVMDANGCMTTSNAAMFEIGPCYAPCDPNFVGAAQLTGTQSVNDDFETNGPIASDQIIDSNAKVDYDSGECIELLPGFETKLGVELDVFIDGCDDGQGGNQATEEEDNNNK